MTFNPMRELLKNLWSEVESMNILCLHNDVEIKAVKAVIIGMENERLERKLLRCLGLADKLQTDGTIYYRDRSAEILDMIDTMQQHYDDMKRRYLWALNRLADATLDLRRVTDLHLRAEARIEELTGAAEDKRLDHDPKEEDNAKRDNAEEGDEKTDGDDGARKEGEGVPGRMARYGKFMVKGVCARFARPPKIAKKGHHRETGEEDARWADKQSRSGAEKQVRWETPAGRGVCTRLIRTPKITRIEDFPLRISAMVKAIDDDDDSEGESPGSESPERSPPREEGRVSRSRRQGASDPGHEADIDLQVYTLMIEIEEKDETIRSLERELRELKDRLGDRKR